jgi:hypothetical protein
LIYAPSASINDNGSADVYTILVGAYPNFNDSSPQDFASPAPSQTAILKQAVLVQ